MSKLTLSALAVLALASAPAYAQDVTFKQTARKTGDIRTETMDTSLELDVSVMANGQLVQSDKQQQMEHRSKTVEVLAVKEGKPTRVRVKYGKLQTIRESQAQGREEQNDELAGKSFILEKAGDVVTVTDDKGGAVDDLTADLVKSKESGSFKAKPSRFSDILPKRPIKIGETINVDPELAKEAFNNGGGEFDLDSMSLTLKETKTEDGVEVAVFAMVIKGEVESGGGPKIAMNMSGRLVIGIETSMPHLFEMAGPIGFKQNQGGVTIEASGKTKTTIKARYTKAKAREATKGF